MKLLTVSFLSAAFLVPGARAQTATPTTPAPAVTLAPSYASDGGSPATSAAGAVVAPGQIIYTPRLPGVTELANAAAAQGVAIERIEQSGEKITIVYKYSNGQNATVAYQLLPAAGTAPTQPAGLATQPPAATYVPAPEVVYAPPPRVVYYDPYDAYYYPRYYYPPVSLSFGFGYRHFGGGFRHRGR